MTSKSKSKVLSAGAIVALGLVAATLISGTASAGHKHHGQPKGPQNPGPIGPLPKPPGPQVDTQWHAAPRVVATRDHRGGGGSTVTVSDDKTRTRGGVQCLGNLCGVTRTVKTAVGGAIKSVKRAIGKGAKIATSSKYQGSPPR